MKNTLFLIVLLCSFIFASHHYVSNVGTASWVNSANIATPCSTAVAFANAAAGDTVFFRGGTYGTPQNNGSCQSYCGYYNVSNSGTSGNPIVFMAYPSELPLFTGLAGGSNDQTSGSTDVYATIFGTANKSYLTFDGFSFQSDTGKKMARMFIGIDHSDVTGEATGYITLKNCLFYGGTIQNNSDDNNEGLRIEGSKFITVTNCKFTQYNNSGLDHNTGCVKMYWDTLCTINNCTFDSSTVGLYVKEAVPKTTIYNNFFRTCYIGCFIGGGIPPGLTDSLTFYNNIITNCTQQGFYWEGAGVGTGAHGNDYVIHNNTIYNSSSPGYQDALLSFTVPGHGAIFYNNIVYGGTGRNLVTDDFDGSWQNHLKQIDHNEWGVGFGTIAIGEYDRNLTYTSLASWQASNQLDSSYDAGCGSSTHPGCGDLASNPLFTNASGNFINIVDFTIPSNSLCYSGGRNGGLIGANAVTVGYNATVPSDTLYLVAGTGGTVTPTSPQIVAAGSIVIISATANGGYVFKNWTRKNPSGTFDDSTHSTANFTVNGNDTVTANFLAVGPPSVSSLIPDSTSVQGGKKIAINGTNFTGTTVKIGKAGYSGATSQTMTSVSSTIDTITTTAFSRGLYKVYITNGGGTDSSKTIYLYKASLIYTPSSRIETQNTVSPGYVATDSAAGDPWDSIGYKTVLPTGLSLNHSSGLITGTPTVVQIATAYVFYAWKYGYKNDSATITITVITATVFYDSSMTWQLSTNNFVSTILNVTTTDTNYAVSSPLAYSTTYQFRIRNNNVDTNSVWSDTTTFTTMPMPVPDTVISVYPSVARIDALSTKAQRTIVVKEHGPNKCTVNTVIWLGTIPLGFNVSYTDSTVTDTLFKYPTMPFGTFRTFLTDPGWLPSTISDTLLNAIRLLNPSIIVTKP